MAANCALYPHNWAVWGGFNKINKLTGRPPPAPEARGGQSLTKDQFVIARARARSGDPDVPRRMVAMMGAPSAETENPRKNASQDRKYNLDPCAFEHEQVRVYRPSIVL